MSKQINDITTDPVISRLLERMPGDVADSFSEKQLSYLRNAIGAREWGRHKVDLRGTVKLFKWRYYYVVLAGRNRRTLSDKELKVAALMNALAQTRLSCRYSAQSKFWINYRKHNFSSGSPYVGSHLSDYCGDNKVVMLTFFTHPLVPFAQTRLCAPHN